ncbi:hypothetical protein CFF26_02520 [Listeria monocytogenes]|nr:hypothetical protein [Listeria monocytogenes]EAF0862040.1 hypothetical protein [Listeria monocytogenes]EAF9292407.1 hypothetical protein [Listeria monocytogenes]MOA87148.1 hypothetical protein [Listeria monocytogenes]
MDRVVMKHAFYPPRKPENVEGLKLDKSALKLIIGGILLCVESLDILEQIMQKGFY